MAHALLHRKLFHTAGTRRNGFAQKVLVLGFLCATSVSSVSLWCGFTRNSSTTETQRTQRLHREERDRDFLCKARNLCVLCASTVNQPLPANITAESQRTQRLRRGKSYSRSRASRKPIVGNLKFSSPNQERSVALLNSPLFIFSKNEPPLRTRAFLTAGRVLS